MSQYSPIKAAPSSPGRKALADTTNSMPSDKKPLAGSNQDAGSLSNLSVISLPLIPNHSFKAEDIPKRISELNKKLQKSQSNLKTHPTELEALQQKWNLLEIKILQKAKIHGTLSLVKEAFEKFLNSEETTSHPITELKDRVEALDALEHTEDIDKIIIQKFIPHLDTVAKGDKKNELIRDTIQKNMQLVTRLISETSLYLEKQERVIDSYKKESDEYDGEIKASAHRINTTTKAITILSELPKFKKLDKSSILKLIDYEILLSDEIEIGLKKSVINPSLKTKTQYLLSTLKLLGDLIPYLTKIEKPDQSGVEAFMTLHCLICDSYIKNLRSDTHDKTMPYLSTITSTYDNLKKIKPFEPLLAEFFRHKEIILSLDQSDKDQIKLTEQKSKITELSTKIAMMTSEQTQLKQKLIEEQEAHRRDQEALEKQKAQIEELLALLAKHEQTKDLGDDDSAQSSAQAHDDIAPTGEAPDMASSY